MVLTYRSKVPSWVRLSSLFVLLAMTGCFNGQFLKQKKSTSGDILEAATVTVPVSDVAGVQTASLSHSDTQAQVMNGVGNLEGVAVSLPPGTLTLDTQLSIGSGPHMTDTLAAVGGTGQPASAPIVVTSSARMDPAQPMTLQLPVPLNLALEPITVYWLSSIKRFTMARVRFSSAS